MLCAFHERPSATAARESCSSRYARVGGLAAGGTAGGTARPVLVKLHVARVSAEGGSIEPRGAPAASLSLQKEPDAEPRWSDLRADASHIPSVRHSWV